MNYRDLSEAKRAEIDLLDRYSSVLRAFEANLPWYGTKDLLQYVAVGVLTVEGTGEEIAKGVHDLEESFSNALPWYRKSNIAGLVRLGLSASLYSAGIGASEFLEAHQAAQDFAGSHKRSMKGVFGMLATFILCLQREDAVIERAQVDRLFEIYREMKKYHWWLTGSDDLPACAALVPLPGTAEEVGASTEAMFTGLKSKAGFKTSEALQQAANFLCLTRLPPEEACDRAHQIAEALRERGCSVGKSEYEEVSILCGIPISVDKIADHVFDFYEHLPNQSWWTSKTKRFDTASSIAIVSMLKTEELAGLADLKALLALQGIIAAQQAAAAAAAAAAG